MMFLPKSFSDLGSASSSMRYCFRADQVKMYTPIEARLLLGFLGFSSKSVMASFSSVLMMPMRVASSRETGMTAMVHSEPFSLWNWSILL